LDAIIAFLHFVDSAHIRALCAFSVAFQGSYSRLANTITSLRTFSAVMSFSIASRFRLSDGAVVSNGSQFQKPACSTVAGMPQEIMA